MLSEKLKQARQELGLTQKQLGELLGISSNTIARYERDEMQPQHPKVLDMALDLLKLKMTPKLQRNVALLAMDKEEIEQHLDETGKPKISEAKAKRIYEEQQRRWQGGGKRRSSK